MGTDANRNYGLHWGEEGASNNPCDEAFMGSAAWSEVENRNLRDFLTPRNTEVKFFNTLHSYGQVIPGVGRGRYLAPISLLGGIRES